MRVVLAAAMIALLTTTAFAQDSHVPRYGEADKEKTPAQIEAEKDAAQAYKRSLSNIPDKGPSDPWGSVRSDTPKTAAATPPAKTGKSKAKAGATN